MLKVTSQCLQIGLGAFAHILGCVMQHLCRNARCNILYRMLHAALESILAQCGKLCPECIPRQKSQEDLDPDCRAAICVPTAIDRR